MPNSRSTSALFANLFERLAVYNVVVPAVNVPTKFESGLKMNYVCFY
jgi:hypothetical protein